MRGHHAATECFSCQKHFNALYLQPLDTLNSVCMCVCVCVFASLSPHYTLGSVCLELNSAASSLIFSL